MSKATKSSVKTTSKPSPISDDQKKFIDWADQCPSIQDWSEQVAVNVPVEFSRDDYLDLLRGARKTGMSIGEIFNILLSNSNFIEMFDQWVSDRFQFEEEERAAKIQATINTVPAPRPGSFDEIAIVQCFSSRDWSEAIGFDGPNLVHCDGQQIKPITVPEALEWLAKFTDIASTVQVDESFQCDGRARWFKLLAFRSRIKTA